MTVGTHAAEIARQGIWASLTGGWYYEPAYSVFCNVVHLYLWIILFLLPLLFGIFCTQTNSMGLLCVYCGFVMLLFAVLKFSVSYLHNLFDTTDPIPRQTKKSSKQIGGESSHSTSLRQMSGSVRSREEAMTGGVAGSSGVETIELVALNSDGGAEGGAVGETVEGVECRSNDNNETSSGAYRMLNVAAVIDDHPHRSLSKRRRTVRIDEMLMGASSSDTATNNINNNNNSSSNHHQSPNKECDEWEDDASSGHPSERGMLPPTFTTLLPADSLELLNIAGTSRRQSDVDSRRRNAGMVRKFSEPCLEGTYRGWTSNRRTPPPIRRMSSDAEPRVRRARSAFVTANKANARSGTMLSQRTLEECKKATRKSYPSKMSSTAAFLSEGLGSRRDPATTVSDCVSFHVGEIPVSPAIHVSDTIGDRYCVGEQFDVPCEPGPSKRYFDEIGELGTMMKPTASCSNQMLQIEEKPLEESKETEGAQKVDDSSETKAQETLAVDVNTTCAQTEKAVVSSSSGTGWTPVFVSLGDLDRPSTSALHRTSERIVGSDNLPVIGNSFHGMDLKGEITKFLEELIDKHPETLDAIENVRMNRLGRSSNASATLMAQGPSTSSTASSSGIQRATSNSLPTSLKLTERSSSTAVAALSDLALRDGTHIAADHEDTSQGAVHSFQDEDGNWWTYAFDAQGFGTAHALGSSRALLEMIQHNNATHPHTKLSALPENVSGSSDDSDVENGCAQRPSTSKRAVATARRVSNGTNNAASASVFSGASTAAGSSSGAAAERSGRQRALSSSSTESGGTYIADTPSAIFHASSSALVMRHVPDRDRQSVSFVNVAARLRGAARRRTRGSAAMRAEQFLEEHSTDRQTRQAASIVRAVRASARDSTSSSLHRLPFFSDITSLGVSSTAEARRHSSAASRSYYYRLKLFPSKKSGKGIKLKLDRLAVAALFDRNNSILSCVFDVLLAVSVAGLAGSLLTRSIFNGLSLILFAIVVAGTHYSLLKSVQPDAASPIHGFNWIVAYSRPVFFCLLGLIVLLIDVGWWDHGLAETVIAWEWNPYRLGSVASASVIEAIRDLMATLVLLLPIAFTLGLLPQVNTMLLHVMEQVEMHVFGGTACFSLISACIQLSKSLLAFALLSLLAHCAHRDHPHSTQNVIFSAFAAVAVSVSFFLSRGSSNPAMMSIALKSIGLYSKCTQNSHEEVSELSTDERCEGARGSGSAGREVGSLSAMKDPLPDQLSEVISKRLHHDLLISVAIALIFFALHCTSMFSAAQPYLQIGLCGLCVMFGFVNHYLYMELRSATPWRLVARPILRAHEFAQFESPNAAKLMIFEIIHFYMLTIEKNILYPLMIVSTISVNKWTLHPYFLALFSLRLLRSAYCQPQLLYIPLAFSFLLIHADLSVLTNIDAYFPLIVYLSVLIWPKAMEVALKLNFILAYVAPWQISWGSAFHAFAQPFSVPHTALVCAQTLISSVVSAPLNPFLGSSFFLTSYVRPVKFWEKDYNTRRVDHSNTRLISQIDRGPMMDDSNLNAVFYEHLTRSLQASLAGDLLLGRWSSSVQPGDCFILASFYLNSLVHIIEVGNGFVTFQLRGLEFRGTYCHQREVEAISEDVTEGVGCCCCSPGSLPGMLSLNTAWVLRWLAWEVVTAKYIVDGYSITDNSAVNLLQVHELRRLLVTLYVKCIIYYALTSSKLSQWLKTPTIVTALRPIESSSRYVDLDPMFGAANDEDFDMNLMGVSRHSFAELYESWIRHCIQERALHDTPLSDEDGGIQRVIAFCFALSVVGRRALASAAHNRHANAAESFLYGLHALFKGDFRITCQRDEWVFADMDLLRHVIAPGVRMALKLHQDHFAAGDDFDHAPLLYERITHYLSKLFISHEHDPAWRRAIIANTPSLLALRHMYDDGQDDYKIIMLNKMHLNMRVIKLNRECVRAFWAGQQQELIFLRNRNPERGSIQNARQVLRNMINSSADQPIGYPIYVSPLTTSYMDTHPQMRSLSGPPITPELIGRALRYLWCSVRSHFGTSGSSNMQPPPQASSGIALQNLNSSGRSGAPTAEGTAERHQTQSQSVQQQRQYVLLDQHGEQRTLADDLNSRRSSAESSSSPPVPTANESQQQQQNSPPSATSHVHAESSIVAMGADGVPKVELCKRPATAGDDFDGTCVPLFERPPSRSSVSSEQLSEQYAKIVDTEQIFKCLDEPLKATGEPLVVWPHAKWRMRGGRSSWNGMPCEGDRGQIVHKWVPSHAKRERRSHTGVVIYLLYIKEMGGCYVPIGETGVQMIKKEEYEAGDEQTANNFEQL